MPQHNSVAITDVQAAQERILGIAHRTPVLTYRIVNDRTNSQVFFKCENFQRTGAFKFRGAYNALTQLSVAQKQTGVITYSSGNHAQAIALAGQLLNIPTTIVMPNDAPAVKQTATRGYGAEIILYNRQETNREELAQDLADNRSLTLIPPYDHQSVPSFFRNQILVLYSASRYYAIQFLSLPPPSIAFSFEDVPHSCRKCCSVNLIANVRRAFDGLGKGRDRTCEYLDICSCCNR